MKRLLLVGLLGFCFAATPGFCAVTGLTAYPGSVTFLASNGSTLVRTDSSPIVVASGTGSAGVTVSVSSTPLNVSCGGSTKPWLSASLGSSTVNAGGYVRVTISANPCGGQTGLSGKVTITAGSTSVSISVALNFYEGGDVTVTSAPAMPLMLGAGTVAQHYIIAFTDNGQPNEAQDSTFKVSATINNWLSAATNGDASDFGMTVDPSKLLPGAYSGVVSFAGNLGSPIQANVDVTLIVPAPVAVITSLNPNSANAGGAGFTLTVTGSGFLNGNSTIEWSSGAFSSALATTYVSATQLTAPISASLIASAGTASVTVVNTGASASNALNFTINPNPATPVITSLSPSSATVGGPAFTLAVVGSGFVAGSNVQWNGAPIATTYVNPTLLTASVSSALIATSSNVSITVLNTGRKGIERRDISPLPRPPPAC